MTSIKKITIKRLISYIESFNKTTEDTKLIDNVFKNSIKSNIEFTFKLLPYGIDHGVNANDYPPTLKDMFDPFIKGMTRYGYRNTLTSRQDINLSFFFAVLSTIYPEYYAMGEDAQYENIIRLRDALVSHVIKEGTFKFYGYDALNWNTKDMIQSIKQFKSNRMVIRLVADYFCVNIFLLNMTEDAIYHIGYDNVFDPFRKTMLISYYDDTFEPILYGDNHLLDYESDLLVKITRVDKHLIAPLNVSLVENTDSEEPEFAIQYENLDKYQTTETPKETPKEEPNTQPPPAATKSPPPTIAKPVSEFTLNSKMKIEELREMAIRNDIPIVRPDRKKKTKNELMADILDVLAQNE